MELKMLRWEETSMVNIYLVQSIMLISIFICSGCISKNYPHPPFLVMKQHKTRINVVPILSLQQIPLYILYLIFTLHSCHLHAVYTTPFSTESATAVVAAMESYTASPIP